MLSELEKVRRPRPENAARASEEEPSKSWPQLEARDKLDQARSGPEDGAGEPREDLSVSVLEQIRSTLEVEDGAGDGGEHQPRPEDDAAVPFVQMETHDAAGPSGSPLALVIEAARPNNPFSSSSMQPQDRDILQQLEQIRLNGNVDGQSPPGWTRQPADIFQVSFFILPSCELLNGRQVHIYPALKDGCVCMGWGGVGWGAEGWA
jgi:hypothetical protein